jgi:GNAT superfamily N-acetyltransferase
MVASFAPGFDRMVMAAEIGYLVDHQKFIQTLASWHHQEWAYLRPGESLEARTARLRTCCRRREIPTVVIAFTGDALLGSAMLIAHDMDTRMDLSPWLAGVFVAPERRCQGIGAALVRRVIDEATVLGVRQLYLYTPSAEQFYRCRGWLLVEHTRYRNTDVAVMSYECAGFRDVGI